MGPTVSQNLFITKLHGLRGIAVLYVVLFHFFGSFFKGGFSGVDLFFLLSGFLVTRSNSGNLQKDELSIISFLKDFYVRRIARIFPMVILTSFFSVFIAIFFTPPGSINKLLGYFVSSILGFSNIRLLLDKSNYFALDQEFNWFTQTWSLGVEEQFYLFFSLVTAIILSIYKKERFEKLSKVFFTLMIISFFATVVHLMTKGKAESVFYMMHFRFWELSLGICLYFYAQKEKISAHFFSKLELGAFVLLLLGLWIPYHTKFFPVPFLLPVIIGGSILMLSSGLKTSTVVEKFLNHSILQYLGSISYSLYLVHWVVVVFLRYSFGEGLGVMFLGALASIGIAHLTYNYIEVPGNNYFRKSHIKSFGLLTACVLICGAVFNFVMAKPFEKNILYIGNLSETPTKNWGETMKCHGANEMAKLKSPITDCLTPNRSKYIHSIFILGDSHAAQLRFPFQEAFLNSSYEVKGIHLESQDDIYDFTWGKGIRTIENGVFDYVQQVSRSGDIIVLSLSSSRFLNLSTEAYRQGLELWKINLAKFQAKGLKTVLVYDSPSFDQFPVERCYFQSFILGMKTPCSQLRDELENKRVDQLSFYDSLKKDVKSDLYTFDLFPSFCDKDQCRMIIKNELMFFDNHHYTERMAKMITPRLKKFLANDVEIDLTEKMNQKL